MRAWVLLMVALGFAQGTLSQNAVQDQAVLPAMTEGQQRLHIHQLKAQQEARFATEESACHAKFAVTDCVTDVRRRRRETMADLNRQEQSLNSRQRKAKGGDQLIRLENKTAKQSDREAGQEVIKPEEAGQPQTGKTPMPPASPEAAAKGKASAANNDAAYRSLQEKKYNDKLQAAREYRLKREKEQASKPVRKVQPLPVPGQSNTPGL
jgi:colicin import membrane protein